MKVDIKDLKVDEFRSGGLNDQWICMRVVHLPSNITIQGKTDRSRNLLLKELISQIEKKLNKES